MDDSISALFSTNEIFEETLDTDSDFNHLRVIFEEVLCTVSYIDVEETVFFEEMPKLKEACDAVICKITERLQDIQDNQINLIDEIKTLINKYNSLVKFATDAVKYISRRVKLCQVQSLPLPICQILFNTFMHCRQSDQLYGSHFASVSALLTDLFKKASALQSSFLHLMNNFIIFEFVEKHQSDVVVKVMEILANIGEIITSLDIKSTAELWKGYLILTQTHIEFIRPRINIEKPLKYFCKQVEDSLKLFENFNDFKKTETNLKIISFNLKIIIKLCGLYDQLGDSHEHLFHLLIVLNRYFIPYLHYQKIDPKMIDLMQVYVSVAAEPLLGCLFSNREFVQLFLKNINCELNNDDSRLAAALLIISVLKKIVLCGVSTVTANEETQQIWLNNDNFDDILRVIFNMVELLHVEFSIDLCIPIPMNSGQRDRIASLYEYLLIHTVSVILVSNEKYYKLIEKLLFESIMQGNVWRALFSSDIWCILARYGPEETCHQQLTFLINVFSILENDRKPELFFLKNLINRLFQLLSNKYKNEIFNAYPPDKYHRLWINDRNSDNHVNFQLVYNHMNSFLNCINTSNFNNMMKSLELIPKIKNPNEIVTQKISGILKCFWMINAKDLQYYWQFQFVWNVCKATKFLIKYLNNKDLLIVLECITTLSESKNKRMQLISCSILESLAAVAIAPNADQVAVFTRICQLFRVALKEAQPVLAQVALETFTAFAQRTQHESILSGVVDGDATLQRCIAQYLQGAKRAPSMRQIEYLRGQSAAKFRHHCECLEPALKKQKIESNNRQQSIDVDALLTRIKKDTDILYQHFQNKNIPQTNIPHLTYIVDKLQSFLQKK